MTERTQEIWKAFCGELTQEPTDDMREALVTSVRKIVELYDTWTEYYDEDDRNHLIWTDQLVTLADELEDYK
jgi:regulator of RNase E activity RraB